MNVLRRLSNLRCPHCGALQGWRQALRTADWLTEDGTKAIDSFTCETCDRVLRLERGRRLRQYVLVFLAEAVLAMGLLILLIRTAMPGGPLGLWQTALVVGGWILLGTIALSHSARVLRLEEAP